MHSMVQTFWMKQVDLILVHKVLQLKKSAVLKNSFRMIYQKTTMLRRRNISLKTSHYEKYINIFHWIGLVGKDSFHKGQATKLLGSKKKVHKI